MKKKSTKIMVTVVSILTLVGIPIYIHHYFEGGTDYYIKVTSNPVSKNDAKDIDGNIQGTEYAYKLIGYDKNGQQEEIEFTVNKETPLKRDAYIKLRVNPNRGPLKWEEVKEADIPSLAKSKLSK